MDTSRVPPLRGCWSFCDWMTSSLPSAPQQFWCFQIFELSPPFRQQRGDLYSLPAGQDTMGGMQRERKKSTLGFWISRDTSGTYGRGKNWRESVYKFKTESPKNTKVMSQRKDFEESMSNLERSFLPAEEIIILQFVGEEMDSIRPRCESLRKEVCAQVDLRGLGAERIWPHFLGWGGRGWDWASQWAVECLPDCLGGARERRWLPADLQRGPGVGWAECNIRKQQGHGNACRRSTGEADTHGTLIGTSTNMNP